MGFPAKLKNMNIFLDGVSQIGIADEVTPPKLALKMEDWRGGGMLGPVEIETGLEKIELDFTLGGLVNTAIKQFGNGAYDGVSIGFRGAYQDDSSGAVNAVEINVTGRYKEIDLGNAKPGGDTAHKYKTTCSYMEMIVDGVQWFQIDLIAGTYIVFGTDRYAAIRAALGA